MSTSPTSSHSSSLPEPFSSGSSSSSSSSTFPPLPITAMREKIVGKILENRVTLIVGDTGCGKSSQVPQFLLEKNLGPILCTQPRRFAVVAVAKMVARARNCEVGGEVGYHIGHSKVFSARSMIVFKTAGVLLDEMREKGLKALKYKVIILDEVHERSVESDLVLVCIKQFLIKNNDLRVVLMSATADIARYKEYFGDLGRGERVEVLAIPSSDQHVIYQRKVLYLEQVAKLLKRESEHLSSDYCSGSSPSTAEAEIKPEVHRLIHDLIIHIHKNERDIEKGILVFLPTYYSLEQQWFLLKPFSNCFKVHILHRSVDIEQALMSMKILQSHRKVILATNIAESSVTIPKVGYVIDSCRSLQVFWDNNRRTDCAELVWVSKSQANQRQGRTGRTCDGFVYRLVTGSFYNQLEDYEPPSILKLSLRQQILLLSCAESKAINDPKALLRKALDPPDPDVVDDALNLLVHIHALQKPSPRSRPEPTFYGRLLSSFTLSFDSSVLILKFGAIGMLREGIILGILLDMQPLPILRPFGQDTLFMELIDNYFTGNSKSTGLTGRKEVICMGNLCAFQFWQCVFKDKYRLERLPLLLKHDITDETQTLLPKIEEEWCSVHNLVLSALRQVAEIYDEIIGSLHRYRPEFLVNSDGLPSYYYANNFQHTCDLMSDQYEDAAGALVINKLLEQDPEIWKCTAVPFLGQNDFLENEVAKSLAAVVKEMRMQSSENISGDHHDGHITGEASLCKFFIKGRCNRGSQCLYSHSLEAKKPVCKFFFSLQGCRNGDSCFFSHDSVPSFLSHKSGPCLPEDQDTNIAFYLRFFPEPSDGCVLVLDDTDLYFSSNIAYHYKPSSIIATTSLQDESTLDQRPAGVRVLWGLPHPQQTIMPSSRESAIPWNDVKCLLWFPRFDAEHLEEQKSVVQAFFEHLAIRMLENVLYGVEVIITMNNIHFSYFQVEKLARECFFFLRESFPFDEESLGQFYDDGVIPKRQMQLSVPISYVFTLHTPTIGSVR
ncbi:PREDICTED: DExH-box ATP-dependent RNA helicase DExH8 [Ipomoea nil]|uniref:DExH-box ATP-dependent RNA helicase DExH8 n=1 Tax=Ipomoea nil TaxID=35883 RepID=UPI000901F140|nr:PREDICTED: DExH-box ATP-dependent RNA helicase DExH8 [Ipomoea nil]